MSVNFSEVVYKNFGKCVKADNGIASVIITVDVGPRIISYSLNGKENILLEDIGRAFSNSDKELKDFFGEKEEWFIYGGHRLWSSPENWPKSYVPDNYPVSYEISGNKITLLPRPTKTEQQHKIVVEMSETSSEIKLYHEITNVGSAPVKLACWALTVCSAGGVEIFPQCTKDNGLLSNRRNVLWSYSDINDERYFCTNRFGTLKQIVGTDSKFKVGINNEDGWAAYINHGQAFIKNFVFDENADYPDYGCNFETFTNGIFLECESLGALSVLHPNESTSINESWRLCECDEAFDRRNEKSIADFVDKYILK